MLKVSDLAGGEQQVAQSSSAEVWQLWLPYGFIASWHRFLSSDGVLLRQLVLYLLYSVHWLLLPALISIFHKRIKVNKLQSNL